MIASGAGGCSSSAWVSFTESRVLTCGAAPDNADARRSHASTQGAAGHALLVPGSLAIIQARRSTPTNHHADVGTWSGLAGISGAVGPFLGGWLIDTFSWRWAFALNLPLAAAVVFAARHVPESRDEDAPDHLDLLGAALVAVGLALAAGALIEAGGGWTGAIVAALLAGLVALVAFVVVEARSPAPMLPLELFRSAQFTGANLTTLAVYAGLGGAFFFVVLHLQISLGYSAIEAGSALLPVTVLMFLLSSRVGALAQRTGPRLLMTIGPIVAGAGLFLLGAIDPGDRYLGGVLPGAIVFGLGLSITVAPLTGAVLGAVEERHLGVASATNNAVARLAGLLAVAVLPGLAGFDPTDTEGLTDAFGTAMQLSALLCVLGGAVAFLTVRTARSVEATTQPSVMQPCHDPCRSSETPATEAAA